MKQKKKKIVYKGKEYIIETKEDETLVINGKEFKTTINNETSNYYKVAVEDRQFNVEIRESKMFIDGEQVENLSVRPYFPQMEKKKQSLNFNREIIKAPIPGKIVQVLVKDGEHVSKDQEIFILEAMKMRNRILCSIDGTVKILVKEQEAVGQDQKLAVVEN